MLQPSFTPPPLSCDAHFHVFGPPDRYPVHSKARYESPIVTLDDYRAFADRLGVERMVFVQPSAYKTDNSCMLDAMEVYPEKSRGIVDIDEDCPDSQLDDLHRRGVRGVRINTSPIAPFDAGRADELIPRVEKLGQRLAGAGWCLEFLGPAWLTEAMMPTMRSLPVNYIVDHMGMFLARDGIDQKGFRDLLDLTESGRCWIKMTGVYRMSQQEPDFADSIPFARALAERSPDRLIWGSDFPHLSFDHLDSVSLFNLLAEWIPEEDIRAKILVTNPSELFDFDAPKAV
ncbi:MAG: amidohydrolase family protein [Nitratireductor sp.]|nr:amidohydrolase family protein [Nitratireductor sp.]